MIRSLVPRVLAAAVLAAALAGGPPSPAGATPRHALRVGQDCLLCHQSASGGGLRTEYASQYLLPERLAMRAPADGGEIAARLPAPRIGDDLVVGADLRTFHLTNDERDSGNNFLQMQASVYLAFDLSPRASAYLHQEFGAGSARAFEAWGQAFVLPAGGWLKAGQFVPAFGWRRDDHRAFTRREFVVLPAFPPHADTGVEVGFRRDGATLQAAVTNGEFGVGRDRNDELAWSARGEYRRDVGSGHLVVGGSWWQHRGSRAADGGRVGEDVWAGGPFAGFRWGRLTWLGEFDWTHREAYDGGTPPAVFRTFTTSQELAWELVQGLEAVAVYDFHDPDLDRQSGAVARAGIGVDARPRAWFAVRGGVNLLRTEDGPDLAARAGGAEDAVETHAQLHFLY